MPSSSKQWVTEQLQYNPAANAAGTGHAGQAERSSGGWLKSSKEYTLLSSWFYFHEHDCRFPNSCPDWSIIWPWAQCKGRQKPHEMKYCFLVTAEAQALQETILLPLGGKHVWEP